MPSVNSERTILFHLENLKSYEKYLLENYEEVHEEMELASKEVVKGFIKFLSSKGLAKKTIEGRIKTLRVFYKIMSEENHLENICTNSKYRVKDSKKIIPFSGKQIEALINSLNPKKKTDLRLLATIMILLDTGIRLSELHKLNVNDVDLKNKRLTGVGKGNKSRSVNFGFNTKKWIVGYMVTF